jgi:hypothetical protein
LAQDLASDRGDVALAEEDEACQVPQRVPLDSAAVGGRAAA